ncbi:hypothetical protein [Gordonia sp. MMO-8]|uniref:hypothetical protein n=1 Tax=Gordonia sp. MMO-8 TaxID=3127886 RepID=UPI0030190555
MSIDRSACKPDEAYLVTLSNGRITVGLRLDVNGEHPWFVPFQGNLVWCDDQQIEELHRLAPEPEEKVLDVPIQPWDTLRAAAQIVADDTTTWANLDEICRTLDGLADRLEAEHKATQERAEQDAAREALIEKAAEAMWRADHAPASFADWTFAADSGAYRLRARALADAGLLAEAVES